MEQPTLAQFTDAVINCKGTAWLQLVYTELAGLRGLGTPKNLGHDALAAAYTMSHALRYESSLVLRSVLDSSLTHKSPETPSFS